MFQNGIEVGINYLVRYNRNRQEYITQIQSEPTCYRSMQKVLPVRTIAPIASSLSKALALKS